MKKEFLQILFIAIAFIGCFSACKKDYIKGGEEQNVNAYKNMTTYDVLNSNPSYDTLVQLIDAAGMKDKINEQNTTFFAPSDYAVRLYLQTRTVEAQNTDINAKFPLDSLLFYLHNNINGTKDSLGLYLIAQPLTYNILTNTGAKYPTELAGDSAVVSYEYTKDPYLGYNAVVSGVPQLVYFTQLWYPYEVNASNPAGEIPEDIGVHTLCSTSGILTQNGVMNALNFSHVLFFYGTKQ